MTESGSSLFVNRKGPDCLVRAFAVSSARWPKLEMPYLFTWKVRVVVLVTPPPVALMVIVEVPVGAVLATVSVKSEVPEPGAAIEAGLKLPVTPEGIPDADNATAESNPPETATVTTAYPLCP